MINAPHARPHGAPCILGIDPGVHGGVAFYFPDYPAVISAEDIPEAHGNLDAATLAQRVSQMRPVAAILEETHSMPKQGVASTFKFGEACGAIRGVLAALGVPVHRIKPQKWKKHFGLPHYETPQQRKEAARAEALRLWPESAHFSRKKDHNRAEAALIARYGADVILRTERAEI